MRGMSGKEEGYEALNAYDPGGRRIYISQGAAPPKPATSQTTCLKQLTGEQIRNFHLGPLEIASNAKK